MKIGMDVGSTTLKCVALDDNNNIVYKAYERHYSKIAELISKMLGEITEKHPEFSEAVLSVAGSAGMGFAQTYNLEFVQEVYATKVAVSKLLGKTDAVIELGGAYPYLIWLVSGTLALLLAPDKFGAVLYLLFGGIYPIFKAMFERLHPIVSWILKLSFFNTSLTLAVIVINFVFGIPDSGIGFAAATYALGNLAFVLYDVAATSAVTLYLIKLRKRLRLGNYFDKKL